MAPNRSPVTNVAFRYDSKAPASPVSAVSTPTSALRAQPGTQRTQDTFYQVREPTLPIDPSVSTSTPPPARLTPGLTNKNPHVRSGVDFVTQRIDVATEGVQGMTSFAYGLLNKWPVVKLARLFGGKGAEGEEEPLRIQPEQFENKAKDDLDGLQGQQEEDAMNNTVPPPYDQSWIQARDDKGVQKRLNDLPS